MAKVTTANVSHLWQHRPGNLEDCRLWGAQESWAEDRSSSRLACLKSRFYPQFQCQQATHAGQGKCIHCQIGLIEMPCGFHVSSGQLVPSGPVPRFSHAQPIITSTWGECWPGRNCICKENIVLYNSVAHSVNTVVLPQVFSCLSLTPRLFQGAPGSQMPEVRKICALGELAVTKGDWMDLGTLPGVSENPRVGLVGLFLQRLVERQCMDAHVNVNVCLYTSVFLCARG